MLHIERSRCADIQKACSLQWVVGKDCYTTSRYTTIQKISQKYARTISLIQLTSYRFDQLKVEWNRLFIVWW